MKIDIIFADKWKCVIVDKFNILCDDFTQSRVLLLFFFLFL